MAKDNPYMFGIVNHKNEETLIGILIVLVKIKLSCSEEFYFLLIKEHLTLTSITLSLLNIYPQYNTGITSIDITTTRSSVGLVSHILTNGDQKIYHYLSQVITLR